MRSLLAVLPLLLSCAASLDLQDTGEAELSIAQVPADVACLRVTVAGTRTVTKAYGVTAGQSTVLSLSGLPLGQDTFSAEAFQEQCQVPGTMATWVSDPQLVTLLAGTSANVTLAMRRNGRADITVDFENEAAPAPTGTITSVSVPSGASPRDITVGSDGNLWFTAGSDRVGRITPAGVVTEYITPTPGSWPIGIVTGADGNLWFAESQKGKVGRIDPSTGLIVEFGVPTGVNPVYVELGPDGNVWFTTGTPDLGKVTPDGTMTLFALGFVGGRMVNAYGVLWIGSRFASKLTRFSTESGQVLASYTLASGGEHLALGPDGNFWIPGADVVVRMSPWGDVLGSFPVSTSNSLLSGIAAGPDGNLWVAAFATSTIFRVTPGGGVNGYPLPVPGTPSDITAGPDGGMWFTDPSNSLISRIAP